MQQSSADFPAWNSPTVVTDQQDANGDLELDLESKLASWTSTFSQDHTRLKSKTRNNMVKTVQENGSQIVHQTEEESGVISSNLVECKGLDVSQNTSLFFPSSTSSPPTKEEAPDYDDYNDDNDDNMSLASDDELDNFSILGNGGEKNNNNIDINNTEPYKKNESGEFVGSDGLTRRERRNNKRREVIPCPTCGKSVNRGSMSKHAKTHTRKKRYACHLCGVTYSRHDYFTKHLLFHTNDRPYECSECGKSFKVKRKLLAHETIHTGHKPFVCSLCDTSFTDSSALYKHIRNKHEQITPYECSFCGKAFAESAHVIRHMRIHTGEKPFTCPVCCRAFNDKSSLSKHVRTHKDEDIDLEAAIAAVNSQFAPTPRKDLLGVVAPKTGNVFNGIGEKSEGGYSGIVVKQEVSVDDNISSCSSNSSVRTHKGEDIDLDAIIAAAYSSHFDPRQDLQNVVAEANSQLASTTDSVVNGIGEKSEERYFKIPKQEVISVVDSNSNSTYSSNLLELPLEEKL